MRNLDCSLTGVNTNLNAIKMAQARKDGVAALVGEDGGFSNYFKSRIE